MDIKKLTNLHAAISPLLDGLPEVDVFIEDMKDDNKRYRLFMALSQGDVFEGFPTDYKVFKESLGITDQDRPSVTREQQLFNVGTLGQRNPLPQGVAAPAGSTPPPPPPPKEVDRGMFSQDIIASAQRAQQEQFPDAPIPRPQRAEEMAKKVEQQMPSSVLQAGREEAHRMRTAETPTEEYAAMSKEFVDNLAQNRPIPDRLRPYLESAMSTRVMYNRVKNDPNFTNVELSDLINSDIEAKAKKLEEDALAIPGVRAVLNGAKQSQLANAISIYSQMKESNVTEAEGFNVFQNFDEDVQQAMRYIIEKDKLIGDYQSIFEAFPDVKERADKIRTRIETAKTQASAQQVQGSNAPPPSTYAWAPLIDSAWDFVAGLSLSAKEITQRSLRYYGVDLDPYTKLDKIYDGITDWYDTNVRMYRDTSLFDEKGNFQADNLDAAIMSQVVNLVGISKVGSAVGNVATKAVGRQLGGRVGQFMVGYGLSYGSYLEQALEKGLDYDRQGEVAMAASTVMALLETIAVGDKLKGIVSPSALDDAIEAALRGEIRFRDIGKFLLREAPMEVVEEVVSLVGEAGLGAAFNAKYGTDFNEEVSVEDLVETAALTAAAVSLVYGAGAQRAITAQRLEDLRLLGENYDFLENFLDEGVKSGKLTEQQAREAFARVAEANSPARRAEQLLNNQRSSDPAVAAAQNTMGQEPEEEKIEKIIAEGKEWTVTDRRTDADGVVQVTASDEQGNSKVFNLEDVEIPSMTAGMEAAAKPAPPPPAPMTPERERAIAGQQQLRDIEQRGAQPAQQDIEAIRQERDSVLNEYSDTAIGKLLDNWTISAGAEGNQLVLGKPSSGQTTIPLTDQEARQIRRSKNPEATIRYIVAQKRNEAQAKYNEQIAAAESAAPKADPAEFENMSDEELYASQAQSANNILDSRIEELTDADAMGVIASAVEVAKSSKDEKTVALANRALKRLEKKGFRSNWKNLDGKDVEATEVIKDGRLAKGERVVTQVITPEVRKDGKVVQKAQAVVIEGTAEKGMKAKQYRRSVRGDNPLTREGFKRASLRLSQAQLDMSEEQKKADARLKANPNMSAEEAEATEDYANAEMEYANALLEIKRFYDNGIFADKDMNLPSSRQQAIKKSVNDRLDALREKGYSFDDPSSPDDVIAEISYSDPDLKAGERVIADVISPAISVNGEVVQRARAVVIVGTNPNGVAAEDYTPKPQSSRKQLEKREVPQITEAEKEAISRKQEEEAIAEMEALSRRQAMEPRAKMIPEGESMQPLVDSDFKRLLASKTPKASADAVHEIERNKAADPRYRLSRTQERRLREVKKGLRDMGYSMETKSNTTADVGDDVITNDVTDGSQLTDQQYEALERMAVDGVDDDVVIVTDTIKPVIKKDGMLERDGKYAGIRIKKGDFAKVLGEARRARKSVSPKNKQDLAITLQDVFDLPADQAAAAAEVIDSIIATMAARKKVSKEEVYASISWQKGLTDGRQASAGARAAVLMRKDGTQVISALTDPDISSPLHEMAHVFQRVLSVDEQRTVIEHAKRIGVQTGDKWTRETSEAFAEAFEKYLREGKSPSTKLQKIFEKFKTWINTAASKISGRDLSPKMREIFDRMLTEGDAAFDAAAKVLPATASPTAKMRPVPTIQAEAGDYVMYAGKSWFVVKVDNGVYTLRSENLRESVVTTQIDAKFELDLPEVVTGSRVFIDGKVGTVTITDKEISIDVDGTIEKYPNTPSVQKILRAGQQMQRMGGSVAEARAEAEAIALTPVSPQEMKSAEVAKRIRKKEVWFSSEGFNAESTLLHNLIDGLGRVFGRYVSGLSTGRVNLPQMDKPHQVRVRVTKPYVATRQEIDDLWKSLAEQNIGVFDDSDFVDAKSKEISDANLTPSGHIKAANLVTNHFIAQGYDAIAFEPEADPQGEAERASVGLKLNYDDRLELIVFNPNNAYRTGTVGSKEYQDNLDNYPVGRRVVNHRQGKLTFNARYRIVPASSVMASHNEETFSKTEGFPVDENGNTANSRNYEKESTDQASVIANAQRFDQTAAIQTPVVTKDGIVVDGNGRTMSRKRAAKLGTDKEYVDYIIANAEMFGIDPVDIYGMDDPMLVLEMEDVPAVYDTDLFANFNIQDKKEMSATAKGVEISKRMSEQDLAGFASLFEDAATMSDVTSNPTKVAQIRRIFIDKGIISQAEIARFFRPDQTLTPSGVEMVHAVAFGRIFDENAIYALTSENMGNTRKVIMANMPLLLANSKAKGDSLIANMNKAVSLLATLKAEGKTPDSMIGQMNIFETLDMDPVDWAMVTLLRGDKASNEGFKKFLKDYNDAVLENQLFESKTQQEFIDEYLTDNIKNYEEVRNRLKGYEQKTAQRLRRPDEESDREVELNQIVGVHANVEPHISEALATAVAMESLDKIAARQGKQDPDMKKKIKVGTGWERGVDGKWRYEIPDPKFDQDAFSNTLFFGGNHNSHDEIVQAHAKGESGVFKLSELIDASAELFKMYPEMKDMMVVKYIPSDSGELGYMSSGFGTKVNPDGTITKKQLHPPYIGISVHNTNPASTIAHEIAHVVQTLEGFAPGANSSPQMVKKLVNKMTDEQFEQAKKEVENDRVTASIEESKLREVVSLSENEVALEEVNDLNKRLKELEEEHDNLSDMMGTISEAYRDAIIEDPSFINSAEAADMLRNKESLREAFNDVGDKKIEVSKKRGEAVANYFGSHRYAFTDDVIATLVEREAAKRRLDKEFWDEMAKLGPESPDGEWTERDSKAAALLIENKKARAEIDKAYSQKAALKPFVDYINSIQEAIRIASSPAQTRAGLAERLSRDSEASWRMYRRAAGEVEARNVQARMGMTPEQRRSTTMESTADIAAIDQIALDANNISNEAIREQVYELDQEILFQSTDGSNQSQNPRLKEAVYEYAERWIRNTGSLSPTKFMRTVPVAVKNAMSEDEILALFNATPAYAALQQRRTQRAEGTAESRFGTSKRRSVERTRKLATGLDPSVVDKMEKERLRYFTEPMNQSEDQVRAWIAQLGLDAATMEFLLDEGGNSLEGHLQAFLGIELIGQLNDAGKYEKAAEVAIKLAEIGTAMGRGVNAFKGIANLTREGITFMVGKMVNQAQDRLAGKYKRRIDRALNKYRNAKQKAKVSASGALMTDKEWMQEAKRRLVEEVKNMKPDILFQGTGIDPRVRPKIVNYGMFLVLEGNTDFDKWSRRMQTQFKLTPDQAMEIWNEKYNGKDTVSSLVVANSFQTDVERMIEDVPALIAYFDKYSIYEASELANKLHNAYRQGIAREFRKNATRAEKAFVQIIEAGDPLDATRLQKEFLASGGFVGIDPELQRLINQTGEILEKAPVYAMKEAAVQRLMNMAFKKMGTDALGNYITAAMYFNMLGSPPTHLTNTLANILQAADDFIGGSIIAPLFDMPVIRLVTGSSKYMIFTPSRYLESVGQTVAALKLGTKLGISNAKDIIRTGRLTQIQGQKYELPNLPERFSWAADVMENLVKFSNSVKGGDVSNAFQELFRAMTGGYFVAAKYNARVMDAEDAVVRVPVMVSYFNQAAEHMASREVWSEGPRYQDAVADLQARGIVTGDVRSSKNRKIIQAYIADDLRGWATGEITTRWREMLAEVEADLQASGLPYTKQDITNGAMERFPADFRVKDVAERRANRTVFRNKPEGTLGVIADILNTGLRKFPPLASVVPFTNILANVFNTWLDYLPPVALARGIGLTGSTLTNRMFNTNLPTTNIAGSGGFTRDLDEQIIRRNELIWRGTLGMVAGLVAFIGLGGEDEEGYPILTGVGPKDFKKKEELESRGIMFGGIRIPYIGYVSYMNWPVSSMLAFLGNYYDIQRYGSDREKKMAIGSAIAGFPAYMLNHTFLAGLSDLLKTVSNSERYTTEEKIAASISRSMSKYVPFNALLNNAEAATGMDTPELTGAWALFRAIPFARQVAGDKPVLDHFGRPIDKQIKEGLLHNVSYHMVGTKRFYKPNIELDKTEQIFQEKGYFTPRPSHTLKVGGVSLGEDPILEYNFILISQRLFKKKADEVVESFALLPPDEFEKRMDRIHKKSKEVTKRLLLEGMTVDEIIDELELPRY